VKEYSFIEFPKERSDGIEVNGKEGLEINMVQTAENTLIKKRKKL
jgi:hypothetical protein